MLELPKGVQRAGNSKAAEDGPLPEGWIEFQKLPGSNSAPVFLNAVSGVISSEWPDMAGKEPFRVGTAGMAGSCHCECQWFSAAIIMAPV